MADCGTFDVGCHLGNLAADVLTSIANAFVEAVGQAAKTIATMWVGIATPNIAANGSGQPSDTVKFLQDSLAWFTIVLLAVSMAVGLLNIAWQYHTGGRARATETLGKALIKFIVVNGGSVSAIWIGLRIGDSFSKWIIDRSVGGSDFGKNLTLLLAFGNLTTGGLMVGLVIIMAILSVLASIAQVIVAVARAALLVVVAGVLPTAASFTTFEAGEQWYRKFVGWTLALLLYKPAASIVYATGFRLAGSDLGGDDALLAVVTGFMFLVLAVLTMPALARFTVPVTTAINFGRSGGGGGAGATVVATGASAVVSGFQSSGGNSGGGNGGQGGGWGSGPTGATGLGGAGGMGTPGAPGAAGAAGAGAAGAAGPVGAGVAVLQAGVGAGRNLGNTATGSGGNP